MTIDPPIRVVNVDAGTFGDAILERAGSCDLRLVRDWGLPGVNGGNCFFATTQMMTLLIEAGHAEGFVATSGIMEHEGIDHVVHSWIECGDVVLNVSNLRSRPIYVMTKRLYYDTNRIGQRFGRLNPRRISIIVKRCRGDLREATKRLFRPAMNVLKLMEREDE